jgi:prepilin-type N-terminal cleavage/methylation domain-containing protein
LLRRNPALTLQSSQRGFTLVEMIVVMTLSLIIATAFYTFFKSSLFLYLNLQADASNFTDLAAQSQRVANVVRGLTDITAASANDLQIYAYFYPTDTYVSQVHYYLNATQTQLLADVTPMTANPPVGTPIPANRKTYTIIVNFKQSPNTNLFAYLNSANSALGLPITDLKTIKAIQVNLGVAATPNNNQAMTLQVSLRNRKNNL